MTPPASIGASLRSRATLAIGNWIRTNHFHPLVTPALICAFVCILVCTFWRAGWFQFFELQVYDRFLKSRARAAAEESKVVIVGITEQDMQRLNTYPVPDGILAKVLQTLVASEPAAVVVDLYRNLPVPGDDTGKSPRLADVFAQNPNLIAIQRLGLGDEPAVRPPPFLKDFPEQLGFNDFAVLDASVDDTVRRVVLMMWEGGAVYFSDSLLATLLYLQSHGIEFALNDVNPRHLRLGKARLQAFEPNDGAYVHADAGGYQVLLDFRGPTKFPTYSLTDAMEEKIPSAVLRGNVVFVGPLASSLKDFLSTPMSKRFPGLMVHAHVVDQLLRLAVSGEPAIRFWNEWQEALWVLLWSAIGTIAGANVRSPLVFVLVVAGCAIALLGAYGLAMAANLWLLVVAPGVAFAGAAVLNTSHQAYLERSQRRTLMQLFSRHVSANIAADIWRQREQFMEGHRPKSQILTGTVFFTDLKGFSSTAESFPAEKLMEWLNEYMEVMSALIEQHGGMVNKYMGDAIMAVFGAPIPRVSDEEIRADAINAVRCALAMATQLDALNSAWQKRGWPTTMMRVGIATGPLVSGSIGGARRLEYTVTGNIVVIAKRLESLEKESTQIALASDSCRILISDQTCEWVRPQFEIHEVGPMVLEGKQKSVGVYVVTGKSELRES